MTSSFVNLLLTSLPAVPAPNKWAKIFPSTDYVALGVLINSFLPSLFELAFQPLMFSTDTATEEADPRLLDALYFHQVQGKRYLSAKTFLLCPKAQWRCRCWLLVSEHLRRLVYGWLRNLVRSKKGLKRYLVCELLDVGTSPVWAVLQNIAHQLLDQQGRSRVCMMWQASGCASYTLWCGACGEEVRDFRRALVALSGMIFRRHIVYFEQFPWCLLQLVDPEAEALDRRDVQARWDNSHTCCLPPGLARDLKKQGFSGEDLADKATCQAILRGYGELLELSVADVECKHALSRQWCDRPFPTITAKHICREGSVCVQEARARFRTEQDGKSSAQVDGAQPAGHPVQMAAKQIRSRAPLMLYRDDFLKASQLGDNKVNPASKEFWADLKTSWKNLLPDARAHYENLSVVSQQEASLQRQQRKQSVAAAARADIDIPRPAADAMVPAATALLAPLALPGHAAGVGSDDDDLLAPYDPWVLASSAFDAGEIPSVAHYIQQYWQQAGCKPLDLRDGCVQGSPVSEEQLNRAWRQNLGKGGAWVEGLCLRPLDMRHGSWGYVKTIG